MKLRDIMKDIKARIWKKKLYLRKFIVFDPNFLLWASYEVAKYIGEDMKRKRDLHDNSSSAVRE